jgi:hypothetical protein
MSNQSLKRGLPIVMAGVAALLLLASLRLPLWHMRLEAPQYRDEEALKIAVFPNRYGGDMREISVLNQYIGVHVPRALPQFGWLPYLLASGAALGLAASLLNVRYRGGALGIACGVLAVGVIVAAGQAKFQMHNIGHKRDQRTVLAGVHDFTPPFLGTSKIAQFTVSSSFGLGAWLIGAAMTLQIGAAWASRKISTSSAPRPSSTRKSCCKESFETGQFAYQI